METLRQLLERESGARTIDLEEVLLVDRAGMKLLANCEANGIELRNCRAYVREWIASERAAGGEQ